MADDVAEGDEEAGAGNETDVGREREQELGASRCSWWEVEDVDHCRPWNPSLISRFFPWFLYVSSLGIKAGENDRTR